ncbi:MAG: DUF1800 family protein [Paludibacter sp.]
MATSIEAVIAANRFGLGARPGELRQAQSDPRGWLKTQLQGARALPPSIKALAPATQVFQEQVEALKERRAAQQAAAEGTAVARPQAGNRRNVILDHYLSQVAARYRLAVQSDESFRERLVHFWSNHFAVSMDKNVVAALAGTLENEAIRPNLHLGFHDLLLAADSHPAMILYLDNQASTGPNSQLAQQVRRRAKQERKVDINENLAREILELHTLGVAGGYTQMDVTSFAKVLSGWSIGGDQGRLLNGGTPGQFVFREALHEPGKQTVLGKAYRQDGIEQPRAVLRDLARHPATAQHIATKLVRHFVADEPPAAAVAKVSQVFRDSDGHLPTVHAAVVDCAEAWASSPRKFKTPHDFVVSTFRALDYVPERPAQMLAPFELLGQRPWTPGSPAGWDDLAGRWDGADALMKRIEWATQIGQRVGVRQSPLSLAEQSLGAALNEHTRMALAGAADAAQGLTLWLVSPEFQRR